MNTERAVPADQSLRAEQSVRAERPPHAERPDPADLALLRAAFGAGDGGAPALGWAAVHAFEAEHGVVLPEPYRTCVAEVADGSPAGPPDYGMTALAELPACWGDDRPERDLSRPFPLTEAWSWEDDERPEEEIEPLVDRVFDHGSLVLGTDGCGMYWHLVITGPGRGSVWHISGEGAVPFAARPAAQPATAEPATAEPRHAPGPAGGGFAAWVAHWAAGRPWFDGE
ncbi:SMI1/KNR4 family protein [Streptomyces sp. NPDC016309]|uniref:SMI1/KNR4 family protein n=1 Tax=Streptomyces sp. NPDC016309 TaxID=3364965 RepID=UPI0036F4F6BE